MTPPDRTIMLREQIADALAYNDKCGPGLVSRGEYLADADAIIAIVREALLGDERIDELCRQRALVPGAESRRTSRAILEAVLAAALPGSER